MWVSSSERDGGIRAETDVEGLPTFGLLLPGLPACRRGKMKTSPEAADISPRGTPKPRTYSPRIDDFTDPPSLPYNVNTHAPHTMAQVTLAQGAEFDTSLALRAKVLSLYSLDTNTDAVRRMQVSLYT